MNNFSQFKPLRDALGAQFKDVVRGYIGDSQGNIDAVDDTDVFNTIYVRRDKDSNERLICYYDPLRFNSEQFRLNMAIKMRAYFDDRPGVVKRVRYCLEGADEILIGQQAGSFALDPAGGFGAVVVHGHTSAADGGQLNIGAAVNSGVLDVAYGGTGNDLNAIPPNDAVPMVYNLGARRIEPANWEFGGIPVGRDDQAPFILTAGTDDFTIRSYLNGSTPDWRTINNWWSASFAPGPTNDETAGFAVGSWWYESGSVLWWCASAVEGAAVWLRMPVGVPLNNYTATTDPTADDDEDEGYAIGSLWFNATDRTLWACWLANSGAAEWEMVGGSSVTNNPSAGVPPTSSDDETLGYGFGSLWYDGNSTILWGCISGSTGSAVWVILSSPIPPPAPIATVTGSTGVTPTDYTLLVDASSSAVTITLPTAADNYGRQAVVKKIDSSANVVTIDGDGANIDGNATHDLTTQWEVVQLHCNGSDWFII